MGTSSVGFNSHLIPKLEGSLNFPTWKILCISTLKASGVWKFIEGTAVVPIKDSTEKDYQYEERLELFHSRAAQARNIILSTCKPHIQQTLADIMSAKDCWIKLSQTYEADGLIHLQDIWANFARCKYQGEDIETFCATFRAAVDKCTAAGIVTQDNIQVLHFVTTLDSYFEHWTANKREQMRRDPKNLPSLSSLINEVVDESRRTRERAALQVVTTRVPVTTPTRSKRFNVDRAEVCVTCRLPNHSADRCFYTHPHLRPPTWRPNQVTMQHVQAQLGNLNHVQVPTPAAVVDIEHDIFASYYAQVENDTVQQQPEHFNLWIADSGASHHFCRDRSLFVDYIVDPLPINTGNGCVTSPGKGTVHLLVKRSTGDYKPLSLVNVRYTPSSFLNTISEDILEQHGISWRSERQQFVHLSSGIEFAGVTKQNGLKVLDVQLPRQGLSGDQHALAIPRLSLDMNLLHRRFAHLHEEGIRKLIQQAGISVDRSNGFLPCDACSLAKSQKIICRIPHSRAERPFQRIHVDTCGKMSTTGIGNKHYFLLFTDDYSRHRWVACLSNKGQAFIAIQRFFSAVTAQHQAVIAELHMDNGLEFGGNQLNDFLSTYGCRAVKSAPYHHEQNGIAERSIGVITQKARAMLLDAHLPKQLWPEAIVAAVYIANRSPTMVNPDACTPHTRLHQVHSTSQQANIGHLRSYGATAYVHIPPEKRLRGEKFIARAKKGYLVGYGDGLNYRIWFPQTNTIEQTAYVQFDETPRITEICYRDTLHSSPSEQEEHVEIFLPTQIEIPRISIIDTSTPLVVEQPPLRLHDTNESTSSDSPNGAVSTSTTSTILFPVISPPLGVRSMEEIYADLDAAPTPLLRRSSRSNKGVPPTRLDGGVHQLLANLPSTLLYNFSAVLYAPLQSNLPRSHKEAMSTTEAVQWQQAELLELQQLKKLNVATLVPLPPGARLLPSKWVYNVKRNGVYKARLVARGDKQRPGMDYEDTFSNVVRPETLRTIFAMTAARNLEAHCVDVVTAFLHSLMEAERVIYIRPPPGYETYDESGQMLVWFLLRALYGLKQANRLWYLTITNYLRLHGFTSLPSDPCVLQNAQGDLLVLWVDDIIIISETLQGIANIKRILSAEYEIHDLGELTDYLGLTISRARSTKTLYVTQHVYIQRILQRFHMESCRSVSAPAADSSVLIPSSNSATSDQRQLYQAMLGSIMYAAVWTRPDISERCSRLGQFAHNPSAEHESCLRRVYNYLQGTIYLGLCYQPTSSTGLEVHSLGFLGYSDASYADNTHDCKSTSGYVFKLANGPISWKSRKQPLTATSSTESEYIAYSIATKEALWLRRLLIELKYDSPETHTVLIYGDNKPAISLTTNPTHHFRTKHIDVPFHFVREQVELATVIIKYLSTTQMPADGLTKPLVGINFQKFVDLLGLCVLPLNLRMQESGDVSYNDSQPV